MPKSVTAEMIWSALAHGGDPRFGGDYLSPSDGVIDIIVDMDKVADYLNKAIGESNDGTNGP